MSNAKTTKSTKKKSGAIKDLTPVRDPKGGSLKTPPPDTLPRGGWDGNHNVA